MRAVFPFASATTSGCSIIARIWNVANALLKTDGYAGKVRSLLGLPPVFG
jgi:hypothetical protein